MLSDAARIIQVVAGLPPLVDGVGDYALGLARRWRETHRLTTVFVAGRVGAQLPSVVDGFAVKAVTEASESGLCRALDASTGAERTGTVRILVHLSGYGYDRNGLPLWLLRGLKRFRASSGRSVRIVTMFHELYATGRPWQKAFWLSLPQRWLAARVLDASDAAVTNMRLYEHRLRGWNAERTLHTFPVFSTIGECAAPLPLSRREPRLVVFGQAPSRRRLYAENAAELEVVCRSLGVREIHDVGPALKESPVDIPGIRLTRHGFLPAEQIRALLETSVAGILNYPVSYLGKSTIFAAYCTYGLLPIVFSNSDFSRDGLANGINLSRQPAPSAPQLDMATAQSIASAAHAWYAEHSLAVQAQYFAGALGVK